ncbi:TPA: conjugal transfer pilus assembly protein TraU [Legionella pneumophila]|uniref:Putative conjugative transfer protein TraU n=3 Tax=Legionella bozemanae TaxID=447 RepID=A0A0W0RFT4_LEGBO|nr:conjugal transfer pilus assembly protein TraU [Legionella bozemanae]KTC69924.1 putative conjugative transfer protein TraU [Legionella bozemanae]STP10137.1 conjugal transfer pilus assembly protein TraU [Legionella bozemanae]HAT1722231.1 conjugal transfer pilus assembly protein TraU [Legionella pneumophila]
MNKKTLITRFMVLFLLSSLNFVYASQCKGHFVNPITDVCWNCLFPLTIGSSDVVKSSYPDTNNPGNPLCLCPTPIGERLGVTIGYWEPAALVDVTPKPWCMVNLGVQLNVTKKGLGGSQMPEVDGRGAFYYVHWYKYPLVYWLQVLTSLGCMETEDFDILYPSELDPTWNDSELAFVLNPEAVLFTSPPARASCAFDASKALAGTAVNSLFWCQGAQGSTYPLTGFVAHQASPISTAALLAERVDFKLHRPPTPAIRDSIGQDWPAVCHTYASSIMPKDRYRYQLVNTLPEAHRCHPFGQSVIGWEAGHTYPGDGDNFGFLIWKKRNCCFL